MIRVPSGVCSIAFSSRFEIICVSKWPVAAQRDVGRRSAHRPLALLGGHRRVDLGQFGDELREIDRLEALAPRPSPRSRRS